MFSIHYTINNRKGTEVFARNTKRSIAGSNPNLHCKMWLFLQLETSEQQKGICYFPCVDEQVNQKHRLLDTELYV